MNIKKIGLTALAGSLVATSAMAGELSLSGGAKLSYVSNGGLKANDNQKASGFAMDQEITASGSGELDNGFTVTLTHGMSGEETAKSDTSSITLDMGDMGTLAYSDADIGGGLTALDNIMPTAYEEANDGIGGSATANVAAMPSGQGFSYSTTIAGATIGVNASDNLSASTDRTDGEVDTTADGNGSSSSIGIQYPVADLGLTVFGGTGTEGQADDKDIDHTTYGVLYSYGPVTVGYQNNDEDDSAASSAVDLETEIVGISFMVNDNLSVSYQEMETTKSGTTADQEIESMQVSYSMGGMSINVKDSEGTNIGNATASTHETTEVLVTFAF